MTEAGKRLPFGAVVVVHLEDPFGSGLAACCGLPYQTADLGKGGRVWLCTGCANAGKPRKAVAAERARIVARVKVLPRWDKRTVPGGFHILLAAVLRIIEGADR